MSEGIVARFRTMAIARSSVLAGHAYSGIVLVIVRFGKVDGVQNAASVTSIDRLVAEFFTVKAGRIQEVQAVMMNRSDAEPTGWNTRWYGPGRGGWGRMPTGQ